VRRGALLLLAACAAPPCDPPDAGRVDNERPEAERLAARALDWLYAQQDSDGRFASAMHGVLRPGWSLTAAVLAATAQLPPRLAAPHAEGIARAFQCLLAAADAGGAIGIDGDAIDYPTYTSALLLQALALLQPAGWRERANQQVARLRRVQLDESLGWREDDDAFGAFGFGLRREPKPLGAGLVDIALQRTVLEALRAAGVPAGDPVVRRALAFVRRCQQADGAFCFAPSPPFRASKAGFARGADGREHPLGYGTATADGLRALLAGGAGDGDPAVVAARAWLLRQPALLPVPGLPLDAAPPVEPALRFYWFATRAAVTQPLPPRAELLRELAARQRADGSFAGEPGMKEDEPLVATCHALAALASLLRQ
jgi:squalene-hopene/tetraprenyl-beta-curcumene cyclase